MNRLRIAALAAALCAAACDAPPAKDNAAPDAAPVAVAPPPSASIAAASPPSEPTAAADAGALAETDAAAQADAGAAVAAAADAGAKPPKAAGSATAERDAGGGAAGGTGGERGGPPAASATAATPTGGGPASPAAPAVPPPEPGSADAVAAEVDTIFVGKKTYLARFKQEHTQKVSGAVKKQSGTLSVEKPNKLSFRYDPPIQNRIVSDGVSLKVYVAEDKQMFVTPVDRSEYPGALSFLMGHGLRPSFTFTFNEKATFTGGPVLVGRPRALTPHYETVMFYIDRALLAKKDPGVIRRVLIVDAQGNRNRFDFENASQPASIDPAEFRFTAPPGTDVKQN
ncbi:LolA family protein [Sorangium sp. So ce1000]|uniref:LolA family protein n=1 Tax=Sorangium sp. So ce1000 TaxID=3133325 RepID=UPI003F62932D